MPGPSMEPYVSRAEAAAASESAARLGEVAQRVASLSQAGRDRRLTVDPHVVNLTELVGFSVLADVPAAERQALLAAASMVPAADRAAGALVGLAVGDSLGAPFEFTPAVDAPGSSGVVLDAVTLTATGLEKAPEMTRQKQLKEGQWTDDTSMALCLADSLLTGRYDGSDVRVRFWSWWHRGYNNGFHADESRSSQRSVGLGMNVGKSLDAIRDAAPPPRYDTPSEDSGNGSLMRLASVPIAFARDVEQAMAVSAESSRTTHPGRIAAAACHFQGFLICRALAHPHGQTMQDFLSTCAEEYLEKYARPEDVELRSLICGAEPDDGKERCWNWRAPSLGIEAALAARSRDGDYNGYPVAREYFGSYCMDGLAVALHSAYHSAGFSEAVVRCVNFLGDADSTAAICGQIAGAFYGYNAIDERLVRRLERWDGGATACRAVLLWQLGAEADVVGFAARDELAPSRPAVERTPEVSKLMEMGFSPEEADSALRRAGGDLEQAAVLLLGA
mmetsp:Transcript_106165/g.298480  ORF Transcript_106165/g.298480 Transcript_106165/m.298480 type:complete len:505 (-) Transcript_106165:196-1710(-)